MRKAIRTIMYYIVLLQATAFSVHAAVFTTNDLEGNWEVHELTSGDSPQHIGWMFGTLGIDISGNATFTSITRSNGDSTLPEDITIAISPSGIVTTADGGGGGFHGAMNSQKDVIVGVMTDGGGGYDLVIFSKHGTSTYTTSDLTGTWYFHCLESGDAPQWTGWTHATLTIDSSGNFVMSSYLNSKGETDAGENGTLNITAPGIITVSGRPSSHGIMNLNKDMMVLTADSNGGGYNLSILSKQGTSTFTTSDLEGSWEVHELTSGDSPQWTGWVYGTQNIDVSGNLTSTSITRSNGDSTLPGDVTVAISSSGVVTFTGEDFHGIMNSRKDIIIGVMTDGGGGYDLAVFVRGIRTINGYSFTSCSAVSTNEYWRSAVGYGWIYDGFGVNSGYTKTINILSAEPVYGVNCLKARIQDPIEGLRYAWLAEDMEGNIQIFRFQYESEPWVQVNSDDDIPNIELKANPDIGDTWSRDFDGIGLTEFEVMSTDAMAGVYENCMKVKVSYSSGGEIHAYYYKEGIGRVKEEQWDASSGFILNFIFCDFCGENFGPSDGYVDVWDLMRFADHWHIRTGESNWDAKFDLAGPNFGDLDGYIDVWDLMTFADHWHEGKQP